MLMVTSGVEFSFDDIMYRQIDGVAMGSPLGPVLANISLAIVSHLYLNASFPLCIVGMWMIVMPILQIETRLMYSSQS